MTGHYVSLDNGTTWPVNVGDIEWRLRHGTPTRSDLLVAASVLGIYQKMCDPTRRAMNAEELLTRAREAQRCAPEVTP